MASLHKEQVLFCGGKKEIGYRLGCYQLRGNSWIDHSHWKDSEYELHPRFQMMQVTMPKGVYILSLPVESNALVVDFLPKHSSIWQSGGPLPAGRMSAGCVVKISDDEFLVIGGFRESVVGTKSNGGPIFSYSDDSFDNILKWPQFRQMFLSELLLLCVLCV